MHPAWATGHHHSARRRRAAAAPDVYTGAARSLRGCRHLGAQKHRGAASLSHPPLMARVLPATTADRGTVSAALLAVRRQYQVRPLDAGQRAPAAAAGATDKNVRHRAASKFQRISSSDLVSQVRHNVSNTAHQVPRRMLQDAALETATARASPNSAHACNAPAGRTATLVKLQLTGRAHTRRMRRAAQVAPRAERQRGRREARCDFSRASMPGEASSECV